MRWSSWASDISSAFLWTPVQGDIRVWPPSELGLPEGTIWKLQKALYGLNTSPRQWQQHLSNILVKELKFHQSRCDPNLFIGPSHNIMVLVYVEDDIFITGRKEVGEEFISNIKE
eukprot:2225599-Amphidinium_carterae.1